MDALILAAALRSREQQQQQLAAAASARRRPAEAAAARTTAAEAIAALVTSVAPPSKASAKQVADRSRHERRVEENYGAAIARRYSRRPPPPSSSSDASTTLLSLAGATAAAGMSASAAGRRLGLGGDGVVVARSRSHYPSAILSLPSAPPTPSSKPKPHQPTPTPQNPRFKPIHSSRWMERLNELELFRKQNGHCLVPHVYPPNPQLARWVKRQRRQYKLMLKGGSNFKTTNAQNGGGDADGAGSSTMTTERVRLLDDLGFTWDSHTASWSEKVSELQDYRRAHGNCAVPSTYKINPGLAVWVKCQRRQYKLKSERKGSSMTDARIRELEALGFRWEIKVPNAAAVSLSSTAASTMSMLKANALQSTRPLPQKRADGRTTSFTPPPPAAKVWTGRLTAHHDRGNDMTLLAAAAAAESMALQRAAAGDADATVLRRPVSTSPPSIAGHAETATTAPPALSGGAAGSGSSAAAGGSTTMRFDKPAGRRLLEATSVKAAATTTGTLSKPRREGGGAPAVEEDYTCLNPDFRRFYEDTDLLRI